MIISFHRSYPLSLNLEGEAQAYNLSVGFKGALDPESGMSVNLVDVDEWSTSLIEKVEVQKKSSLREVLEFISQGLQEMAKKKNVEWLRTELTQGEKAWVHEGKNFWQKGCELLSVQIGQPRAFKMFYEVRLGEQPKLKSFSHLVAKSWDEVREQLQRLKKDQRLEFLSILDHKNKVVFVI